MQTEEDKASAREPVPPFRQMGVRRADIAGFGRVWGWPVHAAMVVLIVLTLVVSVAFLPIALYTFLVLFGTAAQVLGAPDGRGWPLGAACVLGVLAASGLAYLLQDHIVLLGNARARRVLSDKVRHTLDAPSPDTRYFVHVKPRQGWPGPAPTEVDDIGWLLIYPDRLEFVGDALQVTLPQEVVGDIRRGPNLTWLGLGGPWLDVTFRSHTPKGVVEGTLRLLSRDADRLSATGEGTRALETALGIWRSAGCTPGAAPAGR